MKTLTLELVTPTSKVYSGDAIAVVAPGTEGSFEILYNHAPIISLLGTGKLMIRTPDQQEKYFQIQGGTLEVNSNKVIVLAENIQFF